MASKMAERYLRFRNHLEISLYYRCNECRPICGVVLMVMLTGYLPENAKRAFYKADLVDWHR